MDANLLIDANRDYYPIDRVPEFWNWLEYMGNNGRVALVTEIYREIAKGSDDLSEWIKTPQMKSLSYGVHPVAIQNISPPAAISPMNQHPPPYCRVPANSKYEQAC